MPHHAGRPSQSRRAARLPRNFPEEFFYWAGDADVAGPNGESFLLVLALEGAFFNGPVAPGDQFVFARVRIRGDNLTPGVGYTFTHPYGVETFTADALGQIRFSEDIGNQPVPILPGFAFQGPTNPPARVNPFLVWDATPPAPPLGYVGNPAVPHTVTGSPCGTNFFRVTGTGLGAGVQTNFFLIQGKRAVVCGNNFLDLGEQCDDGNTAAGDCCSPTCQFDAAGTACTPAVANPCLAGPTCNATGVCSGGTPVDAPCNDGNACTAPDACVGGVCTGGPAVVCNDNNVCTTDTCVPATGCVFNPNTNPCNDGNACTTIDTCRAGACAGTCPAGTPAGVVEADATVASDTPGTNFGGSTLLGADASPTKVAYLRVRVTGVGTHPVTSARLRLRVGSGNNANSVSGGRIHRVTSCSWTENGVTFNNRPAVDGPVLSSLGAVGLGQTVDFDVTAAIPGDGVYCFAIDSTSTDGVDYNSRQASAGRPTVLLTVGADCVCAPAVTTTSTSTSTSTSSTTSTTRLGATTSTSTSTTSSTSTTAVPPAAPVGTVEADVPVASDTPGTPLGTATLLNVDGGPGVKQTFFRVRVTGVGTRTVTSARLRLRVATVTNAQSVAGGRIHRITSCTWSETAVTWNTRPAIDGATLATVGAVSQGQTVDFNITSAVPGDGVFCFAIDSTNTDGVDYNSRESSSTRPALVLTVG